MRRFQTDPGSARADFYVPYFLEAALRVAQRSTGPNRLVLAEAGRFLNRWDRRYTASNTGAVLFEAALREAALQTWDELAAENGGRRLTPSSSVFARLMHDSASAWWDDRSTPSGGGSRRDSRVEPRLGVPRHATALRHTWRQRWRWSKLHKVNIPHLLRIPALSALDMPDRWWTGNPEPDRDGRLEWAELAHGRRTGAYLHAWTTYPGGQSGNPASPRYKDRIPQWLEGTLEAVHFPARASELPAAQRSGTLTLRPAR